MTRPGYDASLGDYMPRGDQEALRAAYEVPLDEQLDIAEANLLFAQAKVEKLREKLGLSKKLGEVASKDVYPGWD